MKPSFWLDSRKAVVLAVALLVAVGVAGLVYKHFHNPQPASVAATDPTAPPKQTINNAPATPEETQSSDQNKDRIVAEENALQGTNGAGSGSTKAVTPVITHTDVSASTVEVDAFIPGIVEDGGTCTLTLTHGPATLSRTMTGVANSTSTNCPHFLVDRSSFTASGDWTATVMYTSTTASGTSAASTLTVK